MGVIFKKQIKGGGGVPMGMSLLSPTKWRPWVYQKIGVAYFAVS